MTRMMDANTMQSQTLGTILEALVPRLRSGDVRVAQLQNIVEEVLV